MRSSSIWFHAALLMIVVSLLASRASIAADPPQPSITREYDLSDLVFGPPDFTTAPNFNLPRDAAATAPVADPAIDDKQAKADAVKSMTSWLQSLARDSETSIVVQPANEKFSISATSDQHDRITRIADALRERMKIQITVETRILFLGEDTEANLAPALAEQLIFVRTAGIRSSGVKLDEAAVASLLEAAQKDANSSMLTAPRVTIFNGQRAYVLVASQREFTTGFQRSADDKTKWDPKIETVQPGLLLDVQARAADADSNLAIALKIDHTRVHDVREEPFKDAPADAKLIVEIPTLDVRKLDALVSTPANQTMLFHIPAGENMPKDLPRLYVMMRATVNK